MSDVWSTMAGECEHRAGMHVTTGDGALLELCDPGTGEAVPVQPPLEVLAEASDLARTDRAAVEDELRAALGAAVRVTLLAPGTLPVAEHKTRLVYRARPGEPLPPDIAAARPNGGS